MKRRKLLLMISFVLVAIPVSAFLARWSEDFANRHQFWSTPGEIAERAFVPHDGLKSLGNSILVDWGVNSACSFAILCAVFAILVPYRKQIVIILLVAFLGTILWGQYRTSKRDRLIAQYRASKPPPQDFLKTQARPADEALILQSIAGFDPKCVDTGAGHWFQYDPSQFSRHDVNYGTEFSGSCMNVQPVNIEVRQYPNASWAQYEGRFDPAQHVPDDVTAVTKFGNTVFRHDELTYLGHVEYFWVSGDVVVYIDFERAAQDVGVQEEFLRVYLEKYPSTS